VGVKVESGATIAAGSIVLTDIGSKCLAVGNPARILNKNYDNSDLLRLTSKKESEIKL
jgi:serine O-acetyltransferase